MRSKILNSGEYFLSNVELTDLEFIKNWRNEQTDILRQWKPITQKNQDDYWEILSISDSLTLFSILTTKGDKLIGYCGLTNIDYVSSRAEFSFLLNTDLAKDIEEYKKIFFNVLEMLCNYGFKHLNLNKIFTETYAFRVKHIEILENFGLKEEGKLRKHVFKKGKYHDSIVHSMLKEEYFSRCD